MELTKEVLGELREGILSAENKLLSVIPKYKAMTFMNEYTESEYLEMVTAVAILQAFAETFEEYVKKAINKELNNEKR